MDYTYFKDNLHYLIKRNGKLAREVAVDLKIAPGTMSRYLQGKRTPELEYVVRIAEYFGVSIDWLLGTNKEQFDMLPPNVREVLDLYSRASSDDRKVIDTVLSKYRKE